MGFSYRKRIRTGKSSWINVSKSGISGSKRFGPVTINSRGRVTIKTGIPGLTFKL